VADKQKPEPGKSRKARRQARVSNDPKRIAREKAQREADRNRQRGNGKPKEGS